MFISWFPSVTFSFWLDITVLCCSFSGSNCSSTFQHPPPYCSLFTYLILSAKRWVQFFKTWKINNRIQSNFRPSKKSSCLPSPLPPSIVILCNIFLPTSERSNQNLKKPQLIFFPNLDYKHCIPKMFWNKSDSLIDGKTISRAGLLEKTDWPVCWTIS